MLSHSLVHFLSLVSIGYFDSDVCQRLDDIPYVIEDVFRLTSSPFIKEENTGVQVLDKDPATNQPLAYSWEKSGGGKSIVSAASIFNTLLGLCCGTKCSLEKFNFCDGEFEAVHFLHDFFSLGAERESEKVESVIGLTGPGDGSRGFPIAYHVRTRGGEESLVNWSQMIVVMTAACCPLCEHSRVQSSVRSNFDLIDDADAERPANHSTMRTVESTSPRSTTVRASTRSTESSSVRSTMDGSSTRPTESTGDGTTARTTERTSARSRATAKAPLLSSSVTMNDFSSKPTVPLQRGMDPVLESRPEEGSSVVVVQDGPDHPLYDANKFDEESLSSSAVRGFALEESRQTQDEESIVVGTLEVEKKNTIRPSSRKKNVVLMPPAEPVQTRSAKKKESLNATLTSQDLISKEFRLDVEESGNVLLEGSATTKKMSLPDTLDYKDTSGSMLAITFCASFVIFIGVPIVVVSGVCWHRRRMVRSAPSAANGNVSSTVVNVEEMELSDLSRGRWLRYEAGCLGPCQLPAASFTPTQLGGLDPLGVCGQALPDDEEDDDDDDDESFNFSSRFMASSTFAVHVHDSGFENSTF